MVSAIIIIILHVTFPLILMPTHTVPSAPPIYLSVSEVTSSSITVQWGPVNCIHRNGDITGYSVKYGEVGSESTLSMLIPEESMTEATITNLEPSAIYSIQVAAVNRAGTGVYSYPIISETLHDQGS